MGETFQLATPAIVSGALSTPEKTAQCGNRSNSVNMAHKSSCKEMYTDVR